MSAYTKEEFEQYKGDAEFLEVKYYPDFTCEQHSTYEEYIEFFNSFYNLEQQQ